MAPNTQECLGAEIERYLVLECIGKGAMGIVYRAYDPKLDRQVAIKLLPDPTDTTFQLRLLREAQALARLSHPHVIRVHDAGIHDGRVYLVMALAEGSDLGSWLREKRPWQQIVEAFIQAGLGLGAAHAAGLIHRDFKPSNVLIDSDHFVFVGDFGLARPHSQNAEHSLRRLEAATADVPLTCSGINAGTPAYMAPEVLGGEAASVSSDQYSYCVALYEALAGHMPQRTEAGDLEVQTLSSLRSQTTVPRWLLAILRRGLSCAPRDRFASMQALVGELRRAYRRHRLRWPRRSAAAAAATLVAFAILRPQADDTRCAGALEQAETAWTLQRRDGVRTSFLDTGLGYAARVAEVVDRELTERHHEWADSFARICEQSRDDRELAIDEQAACLMRERYQREALIEVFEQADARTTEGAVQAVQALAGPLHCLADDFSVSRPDPPPATIAAEVEAAEQVLAHIRALVVTEDYQRARLRALEQVSAARRLGYGPLLAEALVASARFHELTGNFDEAIRDAQDAFWEAASSRHDAVAVEAAARLMYVVGTIHGHFDQGMEWGRFGEAFLQRIDPHGLTAAGFLNNRATLWHEMGRPDLAIRDYKRVLHIKSRVLGTDSMSLATSMMNLGNSLNNIRDYEGALENYRRALETIEAHVDDDHPLVLTVLMNMSVTHEHAGNDLEAIAILEQVLAGRSKAFGPDDERLLNPLNGLTALLHGIGELERALVLSDRAVTIAERSSLALTRSMTFGLRAELMLTLGRSEQAERWFDAAEPSGAHVTALVARGASFPGKRARIAESREQLQLALEYTEQARSLAQSAQDPLAIATASAQHAHLLCRDADLRAATDSRSEAVLLERFDPNYREEAALLLAPGYELLKGHAALGPTRVYALAQTVCTAALTCDQIPIALEVCERGLWAHDRRLIGKAQFAAHLAQALWVDPSTQARARELMTDALSSLRRMGAGEGLVDPLQEWLESHAVAEPSPSL